MPAVTVSPVSASPAVPLRDLLKAQTRADHDAIDARYGSLALDSADGYAAFLAAHSLAWTALAPAWRRFAGVAGTDYAALLAADLTELDAAVPLPPAFATVTPECDAGVAYVLAGSRLGMATVRSRPNWGAINGRARRFMEDRSGAELFRAVVARLDVATADPARRAATVRSAQLAFRVFHEALDAVEGQRT